MSEMTPFKQLISYETALGRVQKFIQPIKRTETVPIEAALNRVLAADVVAQMAVPPFDRAAMDGYAVRAKDTFGASSFKPRTLQLSEVLHAGESSNREVGRGECVQIATGSPVPPGADAVVMVEFTERVNETVNILEPVYPGENISPRGEDIEEGKTILKEGESLSPAKVGVLATLGLKNVEVYTKPRIAVVPTGTEIRELGTVLGEGEIYDTNSHTLSAVLKKNGAIAVKSEVVADTTEAIKNAIQELSVNDMIVFSGGSSVGERDLLKKVIEELGEVVFHGIQIKPGKPTLFAIVDGKPVFGMPGYPTSCLSNAYLLLVPAVRRMARLPARIERTVRVRLAKRFVSSSGRTQVLTVKIRGNKAYNVFKKSGAITSMAEADGYILLPVNTDVVEKDQEVTVYLF